MVFQSFNLFPHLSAAQNIALAPLIVLKEDRAAAQKAPATYSRGSASPTRSTPTPSSCPAASSSASP